jgi:hypothetical protein
VAKIDLVIAGKFMNLLLHDKAIVSDGLERAYKELEEVY